MKCIIDNIAEAKTAGIQTSVGLTIVLISLISKSLVITLVGVIVLGLGIRGFIKICKDK